MPIRVEIEGKGKVAEFPDGTDQGVIDAVIQRDFFGGAAKEQPPKMITPEEEALQPPGFLGTILNPAEILGMALTGGVSALRLGKPVAREMLDWASQGAIPLIRGGRLGIKNLIAGLGAKEVEKRVPAAAATPTRIHPPLREAIEPAAARAALL